MMSKAEEMLEFLQRRYAQVDFATDDDATVDTWTIDLGWTLNKDGTRTDLIYTGRTLVEAIANAKSDDEVGAEQTAEMANKEEG